MNKKKALRIFVTFVMALAVSMPFLTMPEHQGLHARLRRDLHN